MIFAEPSYQNTTVSLNVRILLVAKVKIALMGGYGAKKGQYGARRWFS